MHDDYYFTHKITEKGIDVTALARDVGFPVEVPVYINPRLWEKHLDLGDDCEYFRLLLIFKEYIEAAYDTDGDVSLFDVESDSEFYLYETLHLKAILKDDELFISLRFDDIYKLFEKVGLL